MTRSQSAIKTLAVLAAFAFFPNVGFAQANTDSLIACYSTFWEGSGNLLDDFNSVQDDAGNVYVAASTNSTDFPTTPGAAQSAYGGGTLDLVIVKFDPNGQVVYSTYLGGSNHESFFDVGSNSPFVADAQGNFYISAFSNSTDYPISPGAAVSTPDPGGNNIVLTKLDPSGQIVFSTYWGANGYEDGNNLYVNAQGDIWLAFRTSNLGLLVTPDAQQPTPGGSGDIGLTKFSPTGDVLYSSYVGGSGNENSQTQMTGDENGNIYLLLQAGSDDMFTTPDAFQPNAARLGNFNNDMWYAKIAPSGQYLYASYFGGSDGDNIPYGNIQLDGQGNVVLIGRSSATNYPVTPGAFQPTSAGGQDMVITKLDAFNQVVFSTYLGSSGRDNDIDVQLDAAGNIYVLGNSNASNFPVTPNAIQPSSAGGFDWTLTKFTPAGELVYSTYLGTPASEGQNAVLNVLPDGRALVAGHTSGAGFPTSPNAAKTAPDGQDYALAVVDPEGLLVYGSDWH